MKVVFTARAEADLSALYDYIADHAGLRIAGEYVIDIEEACLALSDFPLRGKSRPDLGESIRTIPFHRRALIAYRADSETIRILRVLSAGRDYDESDFR